MRTKAEFQDAAVASISNYPTAAQLYQAKDPRLLASIDAMATMLAMLSTEMDIAAAEPFTKARDVTVLADAAIKGVLPFGKPCRVQVSVENTKSHTLVIAAGRRLLDTQGRIYVVDQGASIAGMTTGTVSAVQKAETSFDHAVSISKPFYSIDVPKPTGGRYISEVRVYIGSTQFEFVEDFVNVAVGDKTFHLETDEFRGLKVMFGALDIAGYQPSTGEVITVYVVETEGAFELASGSQFSFEYSYSMYEAGASMTFNALLSPGAAPMDMSTMREVTSYPSIYDTSAVYLANFDFLIRRNLSPLKFLSVWNEQIEEEARGASMDNINCLFVSAEADGVVQATLEENISRVIKKADDSYKISFVTVVHSPITVAIAAQVSAIYDFAVVQQQIRAVVATHYGPDSVFAKRGRGRVLYKKLYDIITSNVEALQGSGSDLDITITDPVESILPEHYRYISNVSLTVAITQSDF